MKILAITACTAGIAHTYIAKEKIENAAKELGDEIKVETQGSIGVENELTPEEIAAADVILISADIRVNKDRFKGKPIVDIPISTVMKSPKGVLTKISREIGQVIRTESHNAKKRGKRYGKTEKIHVAHSDWYFLHDPSRCSWRYPGCSGKSIWRMEHRQRSRGWRNTIL